MQSKPYRRLVRLALAAGMALSVCAAAQAKTTLKLAHFAAESHPAHTAALQFKKNVEARTNGEVMIELYPANQLGSPPDQLEQTTVGVIDMNLPTQGALDKYEKAFATVMTPYAFASYADAHRVLDGPFYDWVAPRLEKKGLVLLSTWEYGFRNVTNSRRPIDGPQDMKGLKLRTPPELQIIAALEAAGASTAQIAFPELVAALNQGVVDGQENPIGVIYHFKLHEVQKHLALTQHVYNSMTHVISRSTWQKLKPEQQAAVREESRSAGLLMRKLVAEQEADELARMEAAGVAITRPDIAKFRAVMQPAYDRVSAYAGKENMKTFLDMLAK
ncbi:TRAP transporter substrate-binding protein [Bordetella genomosp. 13]|uniref:C4-dicarboxylate ABC transporter substrate-binding protein n=1 Tax=Bordetella genomosp. 13 TaxID=463040 RepID=A0A1W6ZHR3_9BORD|nr:TRAP transporter substrate-binding protein [Bordetella genomosp. 13]ARP96690.1 C4-dicarboxylate ABC transporter substrate-binding protein [Bordetella genomosp. 13]